MAKGKELSVVGVVIQTDQNGKRTERPWESFTEKEKEELKASFTHKFMTGAGYVKGKVT